MQQAPRRGKIWSVYAPGRPFDPHQPRPGLVVSEDVRNGRGDDLVVVPIFSAGRLGQTRVPIGAGSSGLRRESDLFCEEPTTVLRDFLARGPFGGRAPESLLERALRAVRRALGEVVPES